MAMPQREEVQEFIMTTVQGMMRAKNLDAPLEADTNFIEAHLIDSQDFVELVAALEERFDIMVDLFDYDPSEYLSAAGLARCVTED